VNGGFSVTMALAKSGVAGVSSNIARCLASGTLDGWPLAVVLFHSTDQLIIMTKFRVFHRTWWKANPSWPDGREPGIGPRRHIAYVWSEEEAREACRAWNATHSPGLLSDKAEYEEA
jgi:hypothetical protein